MSFKDIQIHKHAIVDLKASVGSNTKIWQFSNIMKNSKIGQYCNIGQNVSIHPNVVIGDFVKIQNNVSVYEGVRIEDYVFLGPSCVFTNTLNPRSEINRSDKYLSTLIRRGASLGANSTILCGIEIGYYAFIAAGSVVTKNVPNYRLIVGNPGREVGWMSRHGYKLKKQKDHFVCPATGIKYNLENKVMSCIDYKETDNLPHELKQVEDSYNS